MNGIMEMVMKFVTQNPKLSIALLVVIGYMWLMLVQSIWLYVAKPIGGHIRVMAMGLRKQAKILRARITERLWVTDSDKAFAGTRAEVKVAQVRKARQVA